MKNLSVIATSALLTFSIVAPSYAAPTQKTIVQSQIDMIQAIKVAQQKVQGKVKSIDFDASESEYEVELISHNAKYDVNLNANTGKITNVEREKVDNDDVAIYKALNSTKVDLNKAISIAARNGQVVDVEFDIENKRPVYEVKTLKDGHKTKVVIDANTGRVIKL